MRSDREQPGKSSRRSPAVPVPGMPYRLHSDLEQEQSAGNQRAFDFIESTPAADPGEAPEDAYNPWEEQGWEGGGETPFSAYQEPEVLQEERYFRPMLDLDRELPNAYDEREPYREDEPYPPQDAHPQETAYPEPEFPALELDVPPEFPPEPPKKTRKSEPWRTAVILSCAAMLIFCGVEGYRIAQNILQSQAEVREFRNRYLAEYNEDFTRNAQAVALLPPGETYPPTASPAPVVTPTPTARIEQNDPLIGMMDGAIGSDQSVAPGGTPTPARTLLERYPNNPLLVIRDETAALQVENEDIVGRLIIDGLLSELVVQRNNTFYINHNSMGTYSGYGAVFADEYVSFRTPPENILLYGRTSNEGKAFAPLKGYISQGVDFAARYAFLSFNSLYEEARYVIIAVIEASNDPGAADYFDYARLTFATDTEMLAYAAEAIGRSRYRFNVGVLPTDRLLTLVTLSDGTDSSSIVIICRMLREGERDGYIQQN